MKQLFARISCMAAAFLSLLALFPTPVHAALNPATGDPSERIMGWVFIALGASLIIIIVLFVVLGKNHRD